MTNTSSTTQQIALPAAGRYLIDPGRCSVTFRTRHLFGLAGVSGTVRVVGGEIDITPPAPQVSVTAVLDATSFDSGNARRDADVRGPKFLDVAQHAQLRFRGDALTRTEAGWELAGELTVRGVSRPVTLAVTAIEPIGAGFSAQATARIDRYAFGITAATGIAARYLDLALTVATRPSSAVS